MVDTELGILAGHCRVMAAGLDRAQALIGAPDDYILAQGPFDRAARLGLPQARAEVTQDLFLAYLTTQVLEFGKDEIAALTSIVAGLQSVVSGLAMTLPDALWIVQTTGREEGAAAYTRGQNVIVLPANMVASVFDMPPGDDPLHPGHSNDYLAGIITHELFHILSKNNPGARAALYAGLNYRILDNAVALPDDPWAGGLGMNALRITNPDAPLLDVAIDLIPPQGGAARPMVPVLISSAPYRGGSFFDTLQWIFVEVAQDGAGRWAVVRSGGAPVWHPSDPLLGQYLDLVGRNYANEIFHPDEILAQSFVTAAALPDLALLGRIRQQIWPRA